MSHRTRASTRKRKKTKLSSSSSSNSNSPATLPASRKIRTKTRKPKYLSLKLVQLNKPMNTHQQKQLNLFPLHPPQDDDGENNDVHVASFLFDNTTDTSTSLNSLLSPATTTTTESEHDPLSPSLGDYRCRGDGDPARSLLQAAMKKGRGEKDLSEERWVCYSEVVEKKESEEVESCGGEESCSGAGRGGKLLSLKLDYKEILNAWSDKGSLFVEGDNSRLVPDLHDPAFNNVHMMDGWGNVGNLWRVPEMSSVKVEGVEKENWKTEQRQASVLRYKEKRNNRLFSKRIRYEVRKLNAEKRPRLKGRFVKRN